MACALYLDSHAPYPTNHKGGRRPPLQEIELHSHPSVWMHGMLSLLIHTRLTLQPSERTPSAPTK